MTMRVIRPLPRLNNSFMKNMSSSFSFSTLNSTNYVDTHCHPDKILQLYNNKNKTSHPSFTDLRLKSKDCFPENYEACLAVACATTSFEPIKTLMQQDDSVYGTFGIHPHYADTYTSQVETQLLEIYSKLPKVVAWGEIGLDYFKNHCPANIQKEVFEKQLHHAIDLDLPVVIHTREVEFPIDFLSIL